MYEGKNLDNYAITRKDETDDTTQDAQTQYSNEEEIQYQTSKKDIDGTGVKTNERSGSGEGDSTTVGQDQDSSISFENDTESNASQTDEEEEDWIDYIKRSTREAEEKNRRTVDSANTARPTFPRHFAQDFSCTTSDPFHSLCLAKQFSSSRAMSSYMHRILRQPQQIPPKAPHDGHDQQPGTEFHQHQLAPQHSANSGGQFG